MRYRALYCYCLKCDDNKQILLKVQKVKANFKFSNITVCIYIKADKTRNGFCLKVLSIVWNFNESLKWN